MKVATSAKNALDSKKAVVALESSVISQGLAYPKNLEIAQLDGTVIKDLTQKGVLGRIYAHLISLDNFQRVLARNTALANRAAAKPAKKAD